MKYRETVIVGAIIIFIIVSVLARQIHTDNKINKVVYFKDNNHRIDKIHVFDNIEGVLHEYTEEYEIKELLDRYSVSICYPKKLNKDIVNKNNLKYTVQFFIDDNMILENEIYKVDEKIYYDNKVVSFSYKDSEYIVLIDNKLWGVK